MYTYVDFYVALALVDLVITKPEIVQFGQDCFDFLDQKRSSQLHRTLGEHLYANEYNLLVYIGVIQAFDLIEAHRTGEKLRASGRANLESEPGNRSH